MWDPIGQANVAESANPGDCSKVVGIPTVATDFTYGPTLHNTIPRPLSAADASGNTIWTPDFSNDWFDDFMFGNGVVFDYARVDSSVVLEDFTGKSVVNYYQDMSGGAYNFSGDVIGWIQLPHSAWWYGADQCPGARSNASGVARANAYASYPRGRKRPIRWSRIPSPKWRKCALTVICPYSIGPTTTPMATASSTACGSSTPATARRTAPPS